MRLGGGGLPYRCNVDRLCRGLEEGFLFFFFLSRFLEFLAISVLIKN